MTLKWTYLFHEIALIVEYFPLGYLRGAWNITGLDFSQTIVVTIEIW